MSDKLIKSESTINSLMDENDFLGYELKLSMNMNIKLKRENERLRKALWYISVNSMPPRVDWCEVPSRIVKRAEDALSYKESEHE